jgi:hypothetical protein
MKNKKDRNDSVNNNDHEIKRRRLYDLEQIVNQRLLRSKR